MLSGKKTTLKSMEKKELENIYRILSDNEVTKYDGAYVILPSKEYILENFYRLTSTDTKYLTIINEKGLVIGYTTFQSIKESVNVYSIGITLSKNFWNMGYGQDAIKTLIKYLFLNKNAQRIELQVIDLNTRAIKCYKKCGFIEDGRLRKRYFIEGKYTDVIVMSILKDEYFKQNNYND